MHMKDILIYSTSWKECLQHLEIIFNHQKLAKLKIKLSKCQFFKQHLYCLGHFISKQGIQPLPEKLIAIKDLKEPNNVDELHHFFSWFNWLLQEICTFIFRYHKTLI